MSIAVTDYHSASNTPPGACLTESDTSCFDDDIEYLNLDDFGNYEDDAFQDFCNTLQFDPFKPEQNNEQINRILGKKRDYEPITLTDFQNFSYDKQESSVGTSCNSSTYERRSEGSASADDFISSPDTFEKLHIKSEGGPNKSKKFKSESGSSSGGPLAKKSSSSSIPKMPKIRIPAKDIRRNFQHIFARAYNSCDKEILQYCLQKYCIPDCLCHYKYIGPPRQWSGTDNLQIIGTEAILRFWEVFFLAFPDSLFQIEESKLRVLQSGACSNLSKFVYFGTRVYKLSVDNYSNTVLFKAAPPGPPASSSPSIQSHHSQSSGSNNGSVSTVPTNHFPDSAPPAEDNSKFVSQGIPKEQPFQHHTPPQTVFNKTTPTAPAQPRPIQDFGLEKSLEKHETTILIGTYTLFINPDKKIYKIEFVYSMKNSTSDT